MENFLSILSTLHVYSRFKNKKWYTELLHESPARSLRGSNVYCHFDGTAFHWVLLAIVSPLLASVNCLFFELQKIAFSKESVNRISLRLAMCCPQNKQSKGQGVPLCLGSPRFNDCTSR